MAYPPLGPAVPRQEASPQLRSLSSQCTRPVSREPLGKHKSALESRQAQLRVARTARGLGVSRTYALRGPAKAGSSTAAARSTSAG